MAGKQLLAAMLLFFLPVLLPAQESAPTIPFDPSVRTGQLPNGLKYFLRRNPKPENRAELRLVVKAGSLQEEEDQLGVAHFVEHMAFNGTRHFQKNDLIHLIESSGIRFGADLNAYTSFEETVYMLQARTDSLSLLEKGLLILEDWASGLSFDPAELEKERGVVIAEWRNNLSPDQRFQKKYFPILYQDSRFADRLPIGDPEIIRTIPTERVRQFYFDWYRPELMAIVAVGDFDLSWMESEIIRRFGFLENPKNARPLINYKVPLPESSSINIFTDPEAAFTNLRYSIKIPGNKSGTPTDWKNRIISQLFNGMLNERLLEVQQGPDPPFTFAYSGMGEDYGSNEVYYLSTTGGESQVSEGLTAVLGTTLQAIQHGFAEQELHRQKSEMLRYAERAVRDSANTPSALWAGNLVSYFLEKGNAPSPQQTLLFLRETLEKITVNEIRMQAQGWFARPFGTLFITAPEKSGHLLPDSLSLSNLLHRLYQRSWPPYREDPALNNPLLAETLHPKPVLEERKDSTFQVTEWKLGNGVRVILKPTRFKEEEILMTAFSPGGHSLFPDSLYPSAANAISIMNQSGVGSFSYTQLTKFLSGKTINLSPYIGELEEGFGGNCAPDELELFLQLIYLYMANPRFDSTAVKSFITRQKALYQNMMENPYYVFGQAKEKIKFQNHPRRGIPDPADLETINVAGLEKVYRDRFNNSGDFTFLFCGNFYPDSIKTLVETYLGNLPATGRQETYRDIGAQLMERNLDTVLYGGSPPKALAELNFHGDFEPSSGNRYAFASLLSVLRIRLRENLREEQGGVYGVNVYGSPSTHPRPEYRITIAFNADQKDLDTLVALVHKEIYALQSMGPRLIEIEKVRETQWQTRLKNEKENNFWLGQLAARYRENLSLESLNILKYRQTIDTLSPEMIQCAAQKYLNTGKVIAIRLLPD